MTHPDELLAGFVDGSLSGADRTSVDAHLQTCARCRAEVELAGAGRAALRGLPDPETPDLAGTVRAEVGDLVAKEAAARAPRWYRYGGIAAAAVLAVAIAVSLPKVGTGPSEDRQAAATGEAAPTVGEADTLAALALELQQTDYATADVQALASEAARVAPSEVAGTGSAAMVPVGTAAQTARAQACVARAFPDFPGTPIRLISARFEGTPAYLAVVLEGPAPDQAADTTSVWVADHATCEPLSFTTTRI
jgi:hypothetical protein